ncbi:uncharacterized protein UTRI_05492_B [Ustilago trichophora]|uniref:Uncharacterized protein n=1 Tax=Ustilago trichophora TaxID=86804 RepID=A0A5C3ELB4_9BASI|nr:uncharacterized protein UTRI_05492_B [Ustilago trichophora]
MMSELSFASNLDMSIPTTPIATAKSRRISILPIDHADLSSPKTALKQLQVLQLENVGLCEELEHSEAQKQALQSELEALRSQLSSSSSSSALIPSSTSSSSISDQDVESATKRHSAEIKAAKRLLHRLAAHISSHDPSSSSSSTFEDEEACFNLDQSLSHDPERSIVHTRLTQLTTPDGKRKVDRGFGTDLLDDIASIGSVWEEYARKASFSNVEQSVALKSALSKNSLLEGRLQELEAQLQQMESMEDKEQLITQLQTEISAASERELQLKAEVEESNAALTKVQKRLEETEAKLDQLSAEQELTISAAAKKSAALINALEQELEELRADGEDEGQIEGGSERVVELGAQLKTTLEELASLKAEYEAASSQNAALRAEIDGHVEAAKGEGSVRVTELEEELRTTAEELKQVQAESSIRINALEAELEERKSKSSDLKSILNELSEKKERLHAIQLHNAQIASLQRVLLLQERIVALLERSPDASGEWMTYAQELTASLSQLSQLKSSTNPRCEVSTMTTTPALVEASVITDTAMQLDDSPSPVAQQDVNQELVHSLKAQVEELEARVLRRNEQIGSLQRQLNNVENDLDRMRTNQMLAEETVAELDAERAEHLASIKRLEERIAEKEGGDGEIAETQARMLALTAELEEVGGVKEGLERIKMELEEKVTDLQQQLSAASAVKEEQLEASTQTAEDSSTMHDLKLALNAAQDNISSLNHQLGFLTASYSALETSKSALERQISTLEADLAASTSLTTTQEEELTLLRSSLCKSDDRLSTLQLELDSLHLTLAEHRESASEDADRLDQLQTQLNALRTERDALSLASAEDRAALEEFRATIGGFESKLAEMEANALDTASRLNSEREAKSLLESQLQQLTCKHTELEQVLEQRDAAMTARNTEYWTLKEELAELQELAERSQSDQATASVENLTALQTELESVRSHRDALEQKVATQETTLLKLKSDLSAARSTEELLNEQYISSQRRVLQLEQSASHQAEGEREGEDDVLKDRLEKAEAEVDNLTGRIAELEEELERKAEEIEESDSKILDALKESKKYATRYVKLSARYEALQVEVGKAEDKVRKVEEEMVRLKAVQNVAVGVGKGEGEGLMERSGSGNSLAGRKRAKPESDSDSHVRTGSSRTPDRVAIYAPPPSSARTPSSSFTPIRRTAHPPKSVSRSTTISHKTPTHTPLILTHGLGFGTPINTTTEHGMTRSTSNPSELIAARLSSSPPKPQLLADKTNLVSTLASGTSRLSSKPSKPTTHPLPSVEHVKIKQSKIGLASTTTTPAAKVGAADFLARIKAQRSTSRS